MLMIPPWLQTRVSVGRFFLPSIIFAFVVVGTTKHLPVAYAADATVSTDQDVEIPCPPPLSSSDVDDDGSAQVLPSDQLFTIAGLTAFASTLDTNRLSQLIGLNCQYGIGTHVLTRGAEARINVLERIDDAKLRCFGEESMKQCAEFRIDLDPPGTKYFGNRVDRIAYLRDAQRDRLREIYTRKQGEEGDSYDETATVDGMIILADLDVHELPTNQMIVSQVKLLLENPDDLDVICSAGLMHHPFGYYDMFATVLSDDTFPFPLSGRLLPELQLPNEDISRIRSQYLYSHVDQGDIFRQLQEAGTMNEHGIVPVKSCFGGLAIYRASKWFIDECSYSQYPTIEQMRLVNIEDGRPCEHVVFHDCMMKSTQAKITIQPEMTIWWDSPPIAKSYLLPSGHEDILSGLAMDTGLVMTRMRPEIGLYLQNGRFRLRIDSAGLLVIEEEAVGFSSGVSKRLWESNIERSLDEDWKYLFLTLEWNGELILSQQTQSACPENPQCYQRGPENADCRPCRSILWSSGTTMEDPSNGNWVLRLGNDGVLRVLSLDGGGELWNNVGIQSTSGSISAEVSELKDALLPPEGPCLSSGTHHDINRLLSRRYSNAVLCRHSVFEVSEPIIFSAPYQRLYTEGMPTGEGRALIKVVDESVVTAVVMHKLDNCRFESVVVDGNRKSLGSARVVDYDKPLIKAGGEGRGQVIRNIHAFDARGRMVIHLAEGVVYQRCTGATIEDSAFGPAGSIERRHHSSGIAVSCQKSVIRRNKVVDVTDGGILIYGAPGSMIEDNEIIADQRACKGGINLVAYEPYDGRYEGTTVRRNIVHAKNSAVRVGIAMGSRTWQCLDDEAVMRRLLWGASVEDNILKGDLMHYGYAIDGVRDWTAMNNTDFATHLGVPAMACVGQSDPSAPSGFLIDRSSSSGNFQNEFKDGRVQMLLNTYFSNIAPLDCIPSGDHDSINRALFGKFSEAALCPGAVFELRAPVTISDSDQKIYTQNLQTHGQKATLRIVNPDLATAVFMQHFHRAEIFDVIIDGNHKELGHAKNFGDALIKAGGESTNQVIRNVEAFGCRSWSILQVAEGHHTRRCSNATVENNMFHVSKPSSTGKEAAGVAFACTNSLLRNNMIVDPSLPGISIAGAPGSVIESNSIVVNSSPCQAGISMVDFAPFDGSFEGTVVRYNKIEAKFAPISVGIAMGARSWRCIPDEDMSPNILRGANVTDNIVLGKYMGYGFAVDGVQNWTVTKNVFHADVGKAKVPECPDAPTISQPSSGGFQINREFSSGDFQAEFEDSRVDSAAYASILFDPQ